MSSYYVPSCLGAKDKYFKKREVGGQGHCFQDREGERVNTSAIESGK